MNSPDLPTPQITDRLGQTESVSGSSRPEDQSPPSAAWEGYSLDTLAALLEYECQPRLDYW